ncbi:hypothetical protein L1987_54442 [Smallanthus sonchifolius]|uniref:Uncharacterized protein n=1 Tax=Smallanthus sonchifolius TaxID=185202 RepID=A0ACB9E7K8_9ASTR|nr:hypothetical protein L1987_54442 [Smallanthus sonchifolius]
MQLTQPMMYSPMSIQMSQAMASLPLARSVGMSAPMNVSCPIPITQHPGFTYPHMVHPQLAAYMMAQYANPWKTAYPWKHLASRMPAVQSAAGEDQLRQHMDPMTNGPVATAVRPLMQEVPTTTRMETNEVFRPYRSTSLSCFSERIANFDFPTKIKMPVNIKTYDGTDDPEDNLRVFSGAAGVERWTNAECCHIQRFLANFTQLKKYTKDAAVLYQIKQKEDEGLRSFIDRYKKEGLSYAGATEKMRVSGFMNAVRPKQLIEYLNKNIPQTMDEALERAEAYLRGKEALQNLETKRRDPWKSHHSSSTKPNFHSFVERRSNRHRDSRRTDDHYRPPYHKSTPEKEKCIAFTALTKTPEEIMATEEARYSFRPPHPLAKSSEERSSSKYCEFHDDRGHHTNDCYQLKKRIEEAVKSGELAHLIKDIKKKKDPKGKGKGKETNMIHLTRSETQKKVQERILGQAMHILPPNGGSRADLYSNHRGS